ncbi:hypothetical protein C1H46_033160 [Malus baccata]|uniref:Uncharacterized protein n=1 Tax=Malus baccata TaxID=106549 RepID=A0A540L477_MALBA|nr:hypothetical protein C1H46_033160 [Malus baccata]
MSAVGRCRVRYPEISAGASLRSKKPALKLRPSSRTSRTTSSPKSPAINVFAPFMINVFAPGQDPIAAEP